MLLNEPPPPEKWARIYQAKNAAGIIIGTNGLAIGYGNIQTDNKDTSDVYLPTFDMPGPTMEGLLASVGQMLNEGKNVTGILSYGAYYTLFILYLAVIYDFNAISKVWE